MPKTRENLIETWGEVARELKCSVSWVKKLWNRFGFQLEHKLRPSGRVKMTKQELERFRDRIRGEI